MQMFLCIVSALGLFGLIALIKAAFSAPEAFEDERGFHMLNPADAERYEHSPRVTLTEGDVVFFK